MSHFLFTNTATTEIYTLSLHDALPISNTSTPGRRWQRCKVEGRRRDELRFGALMRCCASPRIGVRRSNHFARSEEHTSELQSHSDLVCRLLLEKKKKDKINDKEINCNE